MPDRILLVEGKDDRHVMWNLFEARKVSQVFDVMCPGGDKIEEENGGDERLLDSIPWRLASDGLERLAVVLDANNKGPKARWDQIRDRLQNVGYMDIPKTRPDHGTIELSLRPRTPRSIRFGVWIMPDNRSNGMLENFVAGLILEEDAMLPYVDDFLESIPKKQRRFSEVRRHKARIHTFLAVSEQPGRPMGQAIKADRHLDANHPTVQPFLNWVQRALVND